MTAALLKVIAESNETVYRIAKETGLDKASLGRFIRGENSLRLDLADKLAEHFKLELVKRKGR